MSELFRTSIERTAGFSIANLGPWDFWAKRGEIDIPENVTAETVNRICTIRAIALRDMPSPSERRN